jgi:hypothetical protein
MTKNYHICVKRDKHLPFDVFSGSSITQGCHFWHKCGSFLSFTPLARIGAMTRVTLGRIRLADVLTLSRIRHGVRTRTVSGMRAAYDSMGSMSTPVLPELIARRPSVLSALAFRTMPCLAYNTEQLGHKTILRRAPHRPWRMSFTTFFP